LPGWVPGSRQATLTYQKYANAKFTFGCVPVDLAPPWGVASSVSNRLAGEYLTAGAGSAHPFGRWP